MSRNRGSTINARKRGNQRLFLGRSGPLAQEFYLHGRAFHAAGRHLSAHFGELPRPVGTSARPILFLYRHATELYLKSLVLAGAKLLQFYGIPRMTREQLFKCHRVAPLISEVEKIFRAVGWDQAVGKGGLPTLKEMRAVLREIDRIDPNAASFRYPVNKKGSDSVPPDFGVDLIHFCSQLDPLLDSVAEATRGLEDTWDNMVEYYYQECDITQSIDPEA